MPFSDICLRIQRLEEASQRTKVPCVFAPYFFFFFFQHHLVLLPDDIYFFSSSQKISFEFFFFFLQIQKKTVCTDHVFFGGFGS